MQYPNGDCLRDGGRVNSTCMYCKGVHNNNGKLIYD